MSTKQQDSGENDPVWNLLDASQTAKASPAFAQDVLRQVRQLDAAPVAPWWKKLLSPAPLFGGAMAAAAAIALMAVLSPDPAGTGPEIANDASKTLDEAFQQELLFVAVEEPDLFSDAELLAMLY